jgi:phosphate transport system protein
MIFAKKTSNAFVSDVHELSRMLADMGELAETQVAQAIEALASGDRSIARDVVERDAAIDSLHKTIDEKVVATIARRRPAAAGLRDVLGILGIASELERIGELAKEIGSRFETIGEGLARGPALELRQMGSAVLTQLRDVIGSFNRRDVKTAMDVWARDENVDRLCALLSRELVGRMVDEPKAATLGVHLLFCTKNLERMGDHATNIAEAIYYMVEGRRLSGERPKADAVTMAPAT